MAGNGRHGQDAALVSALTAGYTVQAAAAKARVSERTARRRMQDDAFVAQLAQARSELIDRTIAQLTTAQTIAVTALVEVAHRGESEPARVNAAAKILELSMQRTRYGAISSSELTRIVDVLVGAALARLAEDEASTYLREVDRALLPALGP
jgi:hypothetical protein